MVKKNNITNQKSFFFEDNSNNFNYEIGKKKFLIREDRIYLLFFIFFCLISIFSIKIIFTSLTFSNNQKNSIYLNSKLEFYKQYSDFMRSDPSNLTPPPGFFPNKLSEEVNFFLVDSGN